jgi:hypothetical protein
MAANLEELPVLIEGSDNTIKALESERPNNVTAITNVPDKFRGKSLDEVIKSYSELESQLGKQGQELGELRKVTDKYILNPPPVAQEASVSDDLDYTDLDPEQVKVVNRILEKKIAPFVSELSEIKKEKMLSKLHNAHPDFPEVLGNKDFQEWMLASPLRVEMFQRADRGLDFNAADELIGNYKAVRGIQSRQAAEKVSKESREEAMKQATMESGVAEETVSDKYYRRADIMELMQNNPKRYQALENEIRKAYQEGRVR